MVMVVEEVAVVTSKKMDLCSSTKSVMLAVEEAVAVLVFLLVLVLMVVKLMDLVVMVVLVVHKQVENKVVLVVEEVKMVKQMAVKLVEEGIKHLQEMVELQKLESPMEKVVLVVVELGEVLEVMGLQFVSKNQV